MIVIRGGNWQRLVPIAEELLEKPDLSKVNPRDYDEDLGVFTFSYGPYDVQVRGSSLRIADSPSLNFKDLLVVRDKRVSRLKRKLKKLWGEMHEL